MNEIFKNNLKNSLLIILNDLPLDWNERETNAIKIKKLNINKKSDLFNAIIDCILICLSLYYTIQSNTISGSEWRLKGFLLRFKNYIKILNTSDTFRLCVWNILKEKLLKSQINSI